MRHHLKVGAEKGAPCFAFFAKRGIPRPHLLKDLKAVEAPNGGDIDLSLP